MRYISVRPDGILDSDTGEVHDKLQLSLLLTTGEGGIICGRNLYPILSSLTDDIRKDEAWTMQVHAQEQRTKDGRANGLIYYSRLSYRRAKIGGRHNRKRPKAIKWLVLNMELFSESEDIESSARALVHLSELRGVKPRYSPGTIGGALLRASPAWTSERNPAPRFISEAARPNMPGNLYALRYNHDYSERALYIDQSSSHHTIAATTPLPDPSYLRARGRFRSVERKGILPDTDTTSYWLRTPNLLELHKHIGVIIATVEVHYIPPSKIHLYPNWAKTPGTKQVWIWTPELRLFPDRYLMLRRVSASLTSHVPDPVLAEYGQWCLDRISEGCDPAVKPAMLAAYGMLAVRNRDSFVNHSIHGRARPPRSRQIAFPLVNGSVYQSTVERKRTPMIQNVVARGVIEAETMVRSLELARQLEAQRIQVLQVYADGIIVKSDAVPLLPPHWRVACGLDELQAGHPNQVLSKNLLKIPGIPNGRRTSAILT